LSQANSVARFAADERLPRDDEGPVFEEAWQAEAFALAVRLHEVGCFSWNEWTTTHAAVLREVRDRGEPDDGSRYYDHWLDALERLVTAKQVVSASDLDRRKAAWIQAYLSTPHGQPVELQAGLETPAGAGCAERVGVFLAPTRFINRTPHAFSGDQRLTLVSSTPAAS
jgi:nitrile hydratase accessory protein